MSYKTDRTASELQKCISLILQNKLRNPDVSPLTTITEVTVSKDLKYATVYVSAILESEKTVKALNASAGFIRHELSVALRNMRTVPNLVFKTDSSVEYGRKIDSILRGLSNSESDS
ncbi:MAG: 30S ribosome-binding factor RbfA [Clostridia bacterium]|nr:30S ribosome-binding factor RbfA [Clostridia bacterium]